MNFESNNNNNFNTKLNIYPNNNSNTYKHSNTYSNPRIKSQYQCRPPPHQPLTTMYNTPLPTCIPTIDIDLIWHAHILNINNYYLMCKLLFPSIDIIPHNYSMPKILQNQNKKIHHAWALDTNNHFNNFRLYMIGRNSNNHWYLACSGGFVSQKYSSKIIPMTPMRAGGAFLYYFTNNWSRIWW